MDPDPTARDARPLASGGTDRSGRIVRGLVAVTVVRSIGRGTFITVMTVYLTRFLGASASQAGLVITAGSLAGVCGSYGFGRLSDRVTPRRIMVALMLAESFAFVGFAAVGSYLAVFPFAMVMGAANLGGSAVRSVVIVREFVDADRVAVRAKMYMANNVGIGVGASVGAFALVGDGTGVSKLVMGSAAVMYAFAGAWGLRLPRSAGAVRAVGEHVAPVMRARVLRDLRFVGATVLSGVLGIHLALIEVAMPLWMSLHTSAPRYMVTVLLVFNTALVIVLQMPVARRSVDARRAGHLIMWAAAALALGNVLMWAAHGSRVAVSLVLSVAAVVAWSVGEVASQAGTWTLSFDLTPPAAAGAYQGFFTMGWHTGLMLGPVVVTSLALERGLLGWLALSGVFAIAAACLGLLAARVPRVDESSEPAPSTCAEPAG